MPSLATETKSSIAPDALLDFDVFFFPELDIVFFMIVNKIIQFNTFLQKHLI